MMIIAFLRGGLGLPVIDVGHFQKETLNMVNDNNPYGIFWGNLSFYIIGILLALIWFVFLQNRIPGHWLIQGIIYGVILSLVAAVVVSPLVSMAAGDPFDLFYLETWFPVLILLAGLTMHIGYGIVLMLCLKYAGVNGIQPVE